MLDFLQLVAAATVEAAGLVLLSRLLFLAGFRLLGSPSSPTRRLLWHAFRLPGNLVHEFSHAAVLLIAGFRVVRVRLSLFDKSGCGHVLAAGRWHSLVPASLGWAAASLAPLAAGIAVLALSMNLLGISSAWTPDQSATLGEQLVARWAAVLHGIHLASWKGALFILILLTVGAELAPSEWDLRLGLRSLLIVVAIACLVAAVFYAAPVGAPARQWFDAGARGVLHWLLAVEEIALAVCGAAAALVVPPLLVREALTQHTPTASARRRVTAGEGPPAPDRTRRPRRRR